MLKKLEPGKTIIGKIDGKVEGVYRNFTVYYGNVVDPVINGKMYHLPEPDYMSLLKEFLQSNDGQQYQVPTVSEVKQAVKELINQEEQIRSAQDEKRAKLQKELEEREAVKKEQAQEEERKLRLKEIQVQEEANALKKIEVKTLKNRNKLLLIISIIMAIINIAVLGITLYFNVDNFKNVKSESTVESETKQVEKVETLEDKIIGEWNNKSVTAKKQDVNEEHNMPTFLIIKENGVLETESGAWIYKIEDNTITLPYGINEKNYKIAYNNNTITLSDEAFDAIYVR